MNTRILLLAISAAALSSCSSVYKTGQTPDDVYYSPAQERPAYVSGQSQDQNEYRGNHDYTGNNYYSDYYLRFKSSNYYRWSTFDDYYWYNWRYNTYLYDPFYSPVYYGNPYASPYNYYNTYNPKYYYTTSNYSGPRMYNLNTYDNTSRQSTYYNPKLGNNINPTTRTYSTSTNDRGGFLRSVFPNSNNSRSSYYNPSSGNNGRYNGGTTRSFDSGNNSGSRSSGTNSGSSSSGSRSSGGSSSGGSAPVRRF